MLKSEGKVYFVDSFSIDVWGEGSVQLNFD